MDALSPSPTAEVEENEDGTATVTFNDEAPREVSAEFYSNLVETADPDQIGSLATELHDLIKLDIDAVKDRDEKYAEGLKRTGLGDEAPGGAKFVGASKTVHPMMVAASIDFQARVMKELMPNGNGPVKDKIIGDVTKEKVDKAKRKSRYMNWQLTEQMPEFRPELEQGASQIPLGGAHYVKLFHDPGQKRPRPVFINIDNMILSYASNSFLGSNRRTHRQEITKQEFLRRVKAGLYVEPPVLLTGMPDATAAQEAADKITGKERTSLNEDGIREIWECYTTWNLEEDIGPAPYIITLDANTTELLAVYRNWKEGDPTFRELEHIVEFPFIPFRGPYPIGLPHMIGGLSAAATGALRALLDSAHISNSQSALKLKGGIKGGQNLSISPTEVKEIEGTSVSTDPDIRKVVMPLPFPPPSNVLLELLGFVVEAGKETVRTTFEDLPDNQTQMPVGTTLALIEQGMVVFSAIHARLHDAMGRLLKILHRINYETLQDHQIQDEFGELIVTRSDFEGPLDVVPVSDPNIFSQIQRASQTALIAQRQQAVPGLYDPRAVEERILADAKIPDPKALLVPKPEPKSLNALNENLAAARGMPVVAFPQQNHLAHLQTHLDFMKSPMFGMSQIIGPKFIPGMIQHIADHMTFYYAQRMYDVLSAALGMDAADIMKLKDEDVDMHFEELIALASQQALPDVEQALGGVPPVIQAAQQFLQQYQPPPMMDPSQATLQIAQMEDKTKNKELDQKAAAEQQKAGDSSNKAAMEQQKAAAQQQTTVEVAQMRETAQNARTQAEIQAKREMNMEDNMTALTITEKELEHDAKTQLSTGTGINPGAK